MRGHAAKLQPERVPGYQELARIAWRPEPSVRPVLAGPSLWIGDWRCAGERRAWTREVSHHAAIELQREGGHVRELGRAHHVIDPTTVTIQPADEAYRIASPTGHPQRSTVLLIAGVIAAEPSVRWVAPHAALLHRRVLAARDPVAREEAALALVQAVLEAKVRAVVPGRASWRRVADEVQHAIATRHREPLTLAVLAQATGVSSFHVSPVFRAVSSHSHFTRAFRAEFGVAPSAIVGRAGSGG